MLFKISPAHGLFYHLSNFFCVCVKRLETCVPTVRVVKDIFVTVMEATLLQHTQDVCATGVQLLKYGMLLYTIP